jgi:hypothetical protein
VAVLPLTVVLVTDETPAPWSEMPPPRTAVFPTTVLPSMVPVW